MLIRQHVGGSSAAAAGMPLSDIRRMSSRITSRRGSDSPPPSLDAPGSKPINKKPTPVPIPVGRRIGRRRTGGGDEPMASEPSKCETCGLAFETAADLEQHATKCGERPAEETGTARQ